MVISFDIETLKLAEEVGGWDNLMELGISCAVFYDSDSDKYEIFSENGVLGTKEISECSSVFERAINENIPLIGHNIKNFDIPLIAKEIDYKNLLEDADHLLIDTLEVLYRSLGFRVALDNLAMNTLGLSKSMDSMEAPLKWRKGHYQEVLDYCKNDVALQFSLYMHGREEGYVRFCGRYDDVPRKVLVSW